MDWDPKELPELQIAYLDHFSKIVSSPEQYTCHWGFPALQSSVMPLTLKGS